MTQPRLVATVDVEELSNLEYVDRHFEPGEHGEIRLFLDRDLATQEERYGISRAADELEAELLREGMQAWPEEPLVELDWNARTVHIRFVAFETDTPQGSPGAFVMAAFLIAPVMIRGASVVMRSGSVARLLARIGGRFPTLGRNSAWASKVFSVVRSALRRSPFARKLLGIAEIAGAGAAIWVMLDTNQRIEILKWPGKMLAKGAGKVGEALLDRARELIEEAGKPMIIGIGVVAVGIGIVLLTRR